MELNGDQIEIIAHQEPMHFYEELRRLIAMAKKRLVLSALYLGSGQKEAQLLQDVSEALNANPDLSVLFILDHSRARRGEKSSIELLSPLVDKFYPRIQVCFYQMPQLQSPPYCWLPFWLQEVVAVYHCKFCISDSTVFISGANLSHDYFTDRQDRYWTIQDSTTVSRNSSTLCPENVFGTAPLVQYLQDFSHAVAQDSWELSPGKTELRPPSLHSKSALRSFLHKQPPMQASTTSNNLLAFPIVQHAALEVEEESYFFSKVLQSQSGGGLNQSANAIIPSTMKLRQVQLCTPYTNFPKPLCQALRTVSAMSPSTLDESVHVQLIGPSVRCHGFAGGQGFKEELPFLHEAALHARLFAKSRRDKKLNQDYNIEWRQYDRAGWTLHRKGLWLGYSTVESSSSNAHEYEGNSEHFLWSTYIGSSNFGERSWQRDLELGFFFLETPSKDKQQSVVGPLQKVLQMESRDLVNTSILHHYHPRSKVVAEQQTSHNEDDSLPLLRNTASSELSVKKSRATRFHIRALAWLLRSVL